MMTLTGRQLNSTAVYTSILQADGSAAFDGQNKVTMTLTQNTVKGVASPLTLTGTYVVQANCLGSVTITTGDTATFNLMIFNQGKSFLLAGTDASYNFTATGSNASANACATAKLAGVYSLNANGFTLNAAGVTGVVAGVGLVQFDGKGAVTVNLNQSSGTAAATPLVLTGTYTLPSSCLGSASLTDSSGNAYSITIVGTAASGVSVNGFDITIGQSGKLTMLGAGHPLYGQPTALLVIPHTVRRAGSVVSAKGECA
jgi:hypothetical protein